VGRTRVCARGRACGFLFVCKYDDPQGKQTVFYASPLSPGRAHARTLL
jgi:hypothetical protein